MQHDSSTPILRLTSSGQPIEWLHWKGAISLHARGLISWSLGETIKTVVGGHSHLDGHQTRVPLPPIIACSGRTHSAIFSRVPPLCHRSLYERDQNLCLYCGREFPDKQLTYDHIQPVSRGGQHRWTNVVAACKRCNQHKGDRLLQECGMELLALPYRPNWAEYLALINSRRILGDQMDFLGHHFSARWRAH